MRFKVIILNENKAIYEFHCDDLAFVDIVREGLELVDYDGIGIGCTEEKPSRFTQKTRDDYLKKLANQIALNEEYALLRDEQEAEYTRRREERAQERKARKESLKQAREVKKAQAKDTPMEH